MKCSILLSVYNAEKTLERTFQSLATQTYQDFQIVCINDGSAMRLPLSFLTGKKKWHRTPTDLP
jgi:GT2 family glycosyltransferase